MPNRSNASDTRAEARRRARMASRGEIDETSVSAPDEPEQERKPGLLERLIPPAPPLRGKSDPLAGFTYTGRWPRVVAGLYLLRQNPLPWVAGGVLWAALMVVTVFDPSSGTLYLVTQITQYVVLIAAGWFGWQRPWLFGVAAGVLGLFVLLAFAGVYPEPFLSASAAVPSGTQLLVFLVYQFFAQLPLLLLLGFVAGWYGGYLRRRLTDQRPPDQRQRRR